MKPTMAESKGPIAETRVTPAPIDRVRHLQPAKDSIVPLSSRFLAVLIDMLLVSFILFPISFFFDLNPLNRVIRIEVLLFLLTWCPLLIFYHTVLEGVRGVRLGKWLLQIAVVAEDLDALGAQRSLVRNVVRFFDALPFIVPYLFGVLIARANSKRQRWGDRLAKSIVINV